MTLGEWCMAEDNEVTLGDIVLGKEMIMQTHNPQNVMGSPCLRGLFI